MLIVGIELHVRSYRQQAPGIQIRSAPLGVLARVVGLDGGIGNQVKGMNCERSFDGQFNAIAPRELAAFPVQVCAVSVRDQNCGRCRKVKRYGRSETVVGGFIRSTYVSISSLEHDSSGLGVVQIERGDLLQLDEGFEVELDARPDRDLTRYTFIPVVFCLEVSPNYRVDLEIRINLWQELNLRVQSDASERKQKRELQPSLPSWPIEGGGHQSSLRAPR